MSMKHESYVDNEIHVAFLSSLFCFVEVMLFEQSLTHKAMTVAIISFTDSLAKQDK